MNPLLSWSKSSARRTSTARARKRSREPCARNCSSAWPAKRRRRPPSGARSSPRAAIRPRRPIDPTRATRLVARLVALAGPAAHEGRARGDEGARHGDLSARRSAPSPATAPPPPGAARAPPSQSRRRRQPARRRVRRQRRPRLQREPDPRRRGRDDRPASWCWSPGVAGLAAGAFAMAAGEYVSVRSQRELFEHQIGLERDELKQYPEAEAQELALIYAAKGLPQARSDQAREADRRRSRSTRSTRWRARSWASIPASWARPSARRRARSCRSPRAPRCRSCRSCSRRGNRALPVGVGVTGVALFAIGATLSLFTGRSAWFSGARMLALGALAGGVTFGIGRLFGVALG